MRPLYALVFLLSTAVGFIGANRPASRTVEPAAPATPSASPAAVTRVQLPRVTVDSELVHAADVPAAKPDTPRRAAPAPSRPPRHLPRSLFARLLFGNGDYRPHPFPTPAR